MPLETATYVSDLVATNPAHSDQLNQADAHLRLIKAALKSTFANFTAAALTSTQAQIDAAVSATVNGVAVLADAGAFFKTNTTDGFTNPAAGEVDVKAAAKLFQFKGDGSLTVPGVITAGALVAPGAIPVGPMPLPWFLATLPDAKWGTYVWANGQTIASANTVCPDYLALVTNTLGGNGTTTCGVPDMREVVAMGRATMGSTASRSKVVAAGADTLNTNLGEEKHALTSGENGAHAHAVYLTDPGHHHQATVGYPAGSCPFSGGSPQCSTTTVSTTTDTTGITIGSTPGGSDGLTATSGSGTPHNNLQPTVVCNYVVRIA